MLFWGVSLARRFLANSARICGRGVHIILLCRNPLLSPSDFTQGHLVKLEWLVTDVAAVRSPDRAEHAIMGVILAGCFLASSGRICGR